VDDEGRDEEDTRCCIVDADGMRPFVEAEGTEEPARLRLARFLFLLPFFAIRTLTTSGPPLVEKSFEEPVAVVLFTGVATVEV